MVNGLVTLVRTAQRFTPPDQTSQVNGSSEYGSLARYECSPGYYNYRDPDTATLFR